MGDGEYTEADFTGQQIVWGEGYMSPGGAAEVAALVAGLDIEGRDVIAGKPALFAEAFRVLRPGGSFTANDLLRPDDGPLPTALAGFVATAGLIYHWASLATTRDALDGAGFTDVAIDDRGAWYRDQLRGDIARLESGPTGARLRAAFGDDGRDAWIDLWSRLEALVAAGDLRPVQLRAIRPISPGRRTAPRRCPGTFG